MSNFAGVQFPAAAYNRQQVIQQQQPQDAGSASGGGVPGLGGIMQGLLGKFTGGGTGGGMGGGMPGISSISGLFGGGEAGAGAGASGAGASGAGSSGMMGAVANPWTALGAAALAGMGTLSHSAGDNTDTYTDWLGPLKNIPDAISKGDWGRVASDAASGPVGAVYNIAKGKNPFDSVINSFGPAGQVPLAFTKGKMPYGGKKDSQTFIDAFTGKGVWK